MSDYHELARVDARGIGPATEALIIAVMPSRAEERLRSPNAFEFTLRMIKDVIMRDMMG